MSDRKITRCLCGAPRQRGFVACRKCWLLVPLPLRQALWDALFHHKGTERHFNAVHDCRSAIRAALQAAPTNHIKQ